MKTSFVVLAFIFFNCAFCQNLEREKIVAHFIADLFNNDIPSAKIVENYIEIKPDKTNAFTLAERKKMAEGIIDETRKGTFSPWFYPDYSIKTINNPKVLPYKILENKSYLIINGIKKIKKNVFVLTDAKEEKILQYFLFNKNKIVSFSLFVKEGNEASFFSY
jgi:hypothetical protein